MPLVWLSKYVVQWYCSSSQRSSTISCGAPESRFSLSLWFILRTSTNLCVRSSSDLSPLSRVIDGLTVIGGTGRTFIIVHSGLLTSFSIPRKIRCSSGIFSSHSRISRAFSLCSPLSAFFSLKVVGLSRIILPCSAPQCMHIARLGPAQIFSISLMIFLNSLPPTPCLRMMSFTLSL